MSPPQTDMGFGRQNTSYILQNGSNTNSALRMLTVGDICKIKLVQNSFKSCSTHYP